MDALPGDFAELIRFVAKWDHKGTNERYAERLRSRFADLEDYHAAVRNRLVDIRAHLDAKDFAAYDDADRCLARLVFAWVPVAEAVEVFKQARVPDSKMYWDVQREAEV